YREVGDIRVSDRRALRILTWPLRRSDRRTERRAHQGRRRTHYCVLCLLRYAMILWACAPSKFCGSATPWKWTMRYGASGVRLLSTTRTILSRLTGCPIRGVRARRMG